MTKRKISAALSAIRRERDPNLKAQMLASLVSALFRERGIELVVVGGSAIEFYTDGAYMSGDLDLCVLEPAAPIPLRLRQELMGKLGATGGPRSWEVAGMFVDLLGPVESSARTPPRKLKAPYGTITLIDAEELLAERVLISVYPQPNAQALACAKQLIGVAVRGAVKVDWKEVTRLARSPEYNILSELNALVNEVCNELKVTSPIDSN